MLKMAAIRFAERTEGAITAFGVFLTIAMVCVGGLGLDVSNAIMARTHLQVAADAAAHAALIAVNNNVSESDAKDYAIAVANASLPGDKFGETLRASDITFGTWDAKKHSFVYKAGADDAVLVNTQRLAARKNPVATYFLNFVGLKNFDVVSQSVFETYIPTCMREGFVADDRVDVTTGNTYTAGFCIHSNSYVEMNNGNTFQDGVIVSMPDKDDISVPNDDLTTNTGLSSALRDGNYALLVLKRLADYESALQTSAVMDANDETYYRSYITSLVVEDLDPKNKLDAGWKEGYIHTLTCNRANQSVSASSGVTIKSGILITNCILQFPENVALEDMIIFNTNTDEDTLRAANGLRIGKNDKCRDGGDVQILTYGGIKFAQAVEIYGSQVVAAKNIEFTSDATGIEGVSLVAGGTITGTTDSIMGFCGGSGMDNNFQPAYFRMAA